MTPKEQMMLKLPYVQTSYMVNELINLDHEIRGTNIRIIEKPGMRKDRFSSLEYNFKICQDLSLKLKPRCSISSSNLVDMLPIQTAKTFSYFD